MSLCLSLSVSLSHILSFSVVIWISIDWSHARDNLILAREASRIEDLERASVHISQACRITLGEDSYVSKMPFIFDQLFVAAEDVDLVCLLFFSFLSESTTCF